MIYKVTLERVIYIPYFPLLISFFCHLYTSLDHSRHMHNTSCNASLTSQIAP